MANDPVLRAADIDAAPFVFRHPLEERAEITLHGLARAAGLTETSVNLGRLEPGKVSFPLHRHHAEEEWIYILSGHGTLRLDDRDTEIGPGDFAAFTAGGPAHKLTNTGTETLTYLMGGNVKPVEIVDFPEHGKRLARAGSGAGMRAEIVDEAAMQPFDFLSRSAPS